jgi:hypothetical protein
METQTDELILTEDGITVKNSNDETVFRIYCVNGVPTMCLHNPETGHSFRIAPSTDGGFSLIWEEKGNVRAVLSLNGMKVFGEAEFVVFNVKTGQEWRFRPQFFDGEKAI